MSNELESRRFLRLREKFTADLLNRNEIPSKNEGATVTGKVTFFDKLITLEELLALLKGQYCRRSIYRWINEGMPYKKIRRRLWFPKEDVLLWLERSS